MMKEDEPVRKSSSTISIEDEANESENHKYDTPSSPRSVSALAHNENIEINRIDDCETEESTTDKHRKDNNPNSSDTNEAEENDERFWINSAIDFSKRRRDYDNVSLVILPPPRESVGCSGADEITTSVDIEPSPPQMLVAELIDESETYRTVDEEMIAHALESNPNTLYLPRVELQSNNLQTQSTNRPPSRRWFSNRNQITMGQRGILSNCTGTIVSRRHKRKTVISSLDELVVPRTSLPYTIERDEITNKWIAILQTDQKTKSNIGTINSSTTYKGLNALEFDTMDEAKEACYAFTPPRYIPTSSVEHCHVCKKKFKLFTRACQCKNCGICMCSDCSVSWPSSMLPRTFNANRLLSVKVCLVCEWLNDSFRDALLQGNYDRVIALHATGNVNLRSPFSNTKKEIFYPVHCAAIGGNVKIIKWLMEERHCPIIVPRKSAIHNCQYMNLVTSSNRSVLDVTMEAGQLDVLRYLIVEKKINLKEYKNINVALMNLASCLERLDGK